MSTSQRFQRLSASLRIDISFLSTFDYHDVNFTFRTIDTEDDPIRLHLLLVSALPHASIDTFRAVPVRDDSLVRSRSTW